MKGLLITLQLVIVSECDCLQEDFVISSFILKESIFPCPLQASPRNPERIEMLIRSTDHVEYEP